MERTRSSLASALRPRRRWLQFSLRGFLVVLTTSCLWLAWKVERARDQREAVVAIKRMGGAIEYDWMFDSSGKYIANATCPWPVWLRRIVGEDFFQNAEHIVFRRPLSERYFPKVIPHLQRLHRLEKLSFHFFTSSLSTATIDELRTALPDCEVEATPHTLKGAEQVFKKIRAQIVSRSGGGRQNPTSQSDKSP